MQTARGKPAYQRSIIRSWRVRIRGIRVKGAAGFKAADIFVPLVMPFDIKHAGFPYIMQTSRPVRKQILYRSIKTIYCRARCVAIDTRLIEAVCPLSIWASFYLRVIIKDNVNRARVVAIFGRRFNSLRKADDYYYPR